MILGYSRPKVAEGLSLDAMIVASIETRRRITTNLIRSNMIYIVGVDSESKGPEDTSRVRRQTETGVPVYYDKTTIPALHLRPTTTFSTSSAVLVDRSCIFRAAVTAWPQDIIVSCCGLHSTFGYVCGQLKRALSSVGANEINV